VVRVVFVGFLPLGMLGAHNSGSWSFCHCDCCAYVFFGLEKTHATALAAQQYKQTGETGQ